MALDLGIDFRVRADLRFSDVGGMEQVKDDIRMKIIHPLKNPELFAAYGKKAGGCVALWSAGMWQDLDGAGDRGGDRRDFSISWIAPDIGYVYRGVGAEVAQDFRTRPEVPACGFVF
jgi:hypothetical protein